MQVVIKDHYSDTRHHLEGNEDDIRAQLLELYPHLLVKFGAHCDIKILVDALNKSQFASASIVDSLNKHESYQGAVVDGQGLGIIRYPKDTRHGQVASKMAQLEVCRDAAAFLAGHSCTSLELRQALLQEEQPELAALRAHNLPVTALKDLQAILAASTLKKSEGEAPDDKPVKFAKVQPTNESSKAFADIIKKASEEGQIEHIKLGPGKHGGGTLKARDPETHQSFILKPGSGKQNPIKGESETGATQSQREAAFYSVASALGLGGDVPEAHLILLDGQEYAAMRFLPSNFKNLNDLSEHDPGLPKRLLSLYNDGTLHKWAALDYLAGNPDRHQGNLMASGASVKLIDHGSAFAGLDFDPAKDGISFVPYYLRPSVANFTKLTTDQKLRVMPRLNAENEAKFKRWLLELNSQILGQLIMSYGIDPSPEIGRLEKLQQACSYQSADLAVISSWVVG
jgi:hypothetical protein